MEKKEEEVRSAGVEEFFRSPAGGGLTHIGIGEISLFFFHLFFFFFPRSALLSGCHHTRPISLCSHVSLSHSAILSVHSFTSSTETEYKKEKKNRRRKERQIFLEKKKKKSCCCRRRCSLR